MAEDQKLLTKIFTKRYFGIEPKLLWQDFVYQRKLREVTREKGLTPG